MAKNKRSPIKACALSMQQLRGRGFMVGKTEQWQPAMGPNALGPGVRKDLFGFIDVIALTGGSILAVQSCARSGMSSHRRKMAIDCHTAVKRWLESGGQLELHGWDRHEVACTSPGAKNPTKVENRVEVETITLPVLAEIRELYLAKCPEALTDADAPF